MTVGEIEETLVLSPSLSLPRSPTCLGHGSISIKFLARQATRLIGRVVARRRGMDGGRAQGRGTRGTQLLV